jgi:hypothetical protein
MTAPEEQRLPRRLAAAKIKSVTSNEAHTIRSALSVDTEAIVFKFVIPNSANG